MNGHVGKTPALRQRRGVRPALGGVFVVALAAPTAQAASEISWRDILDDHRTTGDVVSYGLGPRGQRFSPLDQIDRANVADLVPAWAFSFGGGKQRGQEAQPLVHDGTIFVTASYSRIFAVDARTGHERWQYDHALPDDLKVCCDVINRGAALWGDLVIFATSMRSCSRSTARRARCGGRIASMTTERATPRLRLR